MPRLPDLALIRPENARFRRALSYEEPQQWRLRDCTLTLLPVHCKEARRTLRRSLNLASAAGCHLVALPPAAREQLPQAPLFLADGRLFQLSSLMQRLDLDCPGWRKDRASLSADDTFSCLAARLLAPHITRLHVYGKDAGRRQALAHLIYQESGLIVSQSSHPAQDSVNILPPQPGQYAGNNAYTWQNWPRWAHTAQDQRIETYLAEGLLLSAGGRPTQLRPIQLLHTLNRRSHFQTILPV